MLTLKEILHKSANHTLHQDERSTLMRVKSDGKVYKVNAYRGDGGRKCSVGVLIKDEFYTDKIEFTSIQDLIRHKKFRSQLTDKLELLGGTSDMHYRESVPVLEEALRRSGIDTDDPRVLDLICDAQLIHDTVRPIRWHICFDRLARRFNIEWYKPVTVVKPPASFFVGPRRQ